MRGKTKFDFVNTTETNIIFHVFEDLVTFHEFLIFLCHLDFQVSHLTIYISCYDSFGLSFCFKFGYSCFTMFY